MRQKMPGSQCCSAFDRPSSSTFDSAVKVGRSARWSIGRSVHNYLLGCAVSRGGLRRFSLHEKVDVGIARLGASDVLQ